MSNINNRLNSTECKDISLTYTKVVDTSVFVKDDDLYGNSLVWKESIKPTAEAIQNSLLVKETKNSLVVRALVRNSYKDNIDIISVCKKMKQFSIIETGRCSMWKDIVAVDIDESLSPQEFWYRLKKIEKLPSCIITQNKSSKHWQIQFILDYSLPVRMLVNKKRRSKNGKVFNYPDIEPYSLNCIRYSKLVCALSYKFKDIFSKTDIHYHGTLCRNPFNFGQNSYFVHNYRINHLDKCFITKVSIESLEQFVSDVIIRKNASIKSPVITEENDSRHNLTLKYGRDFVWNYIRENNVIPEMSELSEYLHSKSEEIADLCGKEVHSWKEIESQVKSIYNCSVNNYKQEYGSSSKQWKSSVEWNKHQKQAKIIRAKKLKSTFQSLRSAGYSLKEIADTFNMSRTTLYSYLLLFMVIDTVATAVKKNKMYIQNSWDVIINGIKNAIDEIKRCKIHWKELDNYDNSIEDFEHFVNYKYLTVEGNWFELAA